jgi:hypothetical protein
MDDTEDVTLLSSHDVSEVSRKHMSQPYRRGCRGRQLRDTRSGVDLQDPIFPAYQAQQKTRQACFAHDIHLYCTTLVRVNIPDQLHEPENASRL